MKLMIDLTEKDYKFIKELQSLIIGGRGSYKTIQQNVINAIKNSIPYNPSGELISREALKDYARKVMNDKDALTIMHLELFDNIIDNAPTIEFPPVINMKPLTAEEKQGLIDALKKSRFTVVKLDDEGIRGEPNEKLAEKINEKLINEYISKVGCCDECFASVYCTVNRLRESRVPQDYCVKNIKRYFGDNTNLTEVQDIEKESAE